eukprot:GHVQ01029825.1.p1 GENE.GHVQ01029825.1~~GHVQ01029825.1.p1  ORF type:complete len:378 (-),score=31.04 GHVQ01029825.1:937-2070(-)
MGPQNKEKLPCVPGLFLSCSSILPSCSSTLPSCSSIPSTAPSTDRSSNEEKPEEWLLNSFKLLLDKAVEHCDPDWYSSNQEDDVMYSPIEMAGDTPPVGPYMSCDPADALSKKNLRVWLINGQTPRRDQGRIVDRAAYVLTKQKVDHIYIPTTGDGNIFGEILLNKMRPHSLAMAEPTTEIDWHDNYVSSDEPSIFVERLERTHFYGWLPYSCTMLPRPPIARSTCKSRPQRNRRPSVERVDLKGKRCLRPPLKKNVVDVVKEVNPLHDREILNVVVVAEGNVIKELIENSVNRMLNNRIKQGSISIINTSHAKLGTSDLTNFRYFLRGTPTKTSVPVLPRVASKGRTQGCRQYDNSLISYLEVYNDYEYLSSQELL